MDLLRPHIIALVTALFVMGSSIAIGQSGSPKADKQADKSQSVKQIPLFITPGETNLWKRIELGMQLGGYEDRPRVQTQLNWYAKHPEYIDRVAERAEPFLFLIVEEVHKRNIPMEIALLPIVESAFQPFAYSHGRAAGIWQFIPGTGRIFGLKQNWWYDGRRDIVASTHAALDYLERLHKQLNNDWLLALAAYNSGAGNVRKAIRYNKKRGRPTDFWNLRLPDETRAYVPKLLAISHLLANPLHYNIDLKPISNEPRLTQVAVGSQIDLALVAQLADISLEEVYKLNPAYNRWATSPNDHHKLLIPLEKRQHFLDGLAKTPKSARVQWKRHKIKPGQTLTHIAKRYRTTVKLLKEINGVRGHSIRAGRHILVPLSTRSLGQYSLTKGQRKQAKLSQKRPGNKLIYIVRPGDTFWDLSRKFKVGMRTLARWNGMAPRDTLKPGSKLVIWTKSRQQARISHINSRLPAATIRKIHYTVRRGDSLARISAKFKVTVAQLRRWNRLPKGKYLQPGQRLQLYVDVTRQT